jgi:hypothetical protein
LDTHTKKVVVVSVHGQLSYCWPTKMWNGTTIISEWYGSLIVVEETSLKAAFQFQGEISLENTVPFC